MQIQCVVSRRVFTVEDFWLDVGQWKARKYDYVMQGVLYKRDTLNFLRTFFCGLELDFESMERNSVLSLNGQRPDQHFVLSAPYAKPVSMQNPMPHPIHHNFYSTAPTPAMESTVAPTFHVADQGVTPSCRRLLPYRVQLFQK